MSDNEVIEAAVDRVKARENAQVTVTLPLMAQLHSWTGEADIQLSAPSDPSHPCLMVWEPARQAWRAIVLPPNSEWTISPSKSRLWKPGR